MIRYTYIITAILSLFSANTFAAITINAAADSSKIPAINSTAYTLCPKGTASGTTLSSSSQAINLNPNNNIDCTYEMFAGATGWGSGVGGGAYNNQCPSDRPYLHRMHETWRGIPLSIWAASTMYYQCCKGPEPTMSNTSAWDTATNCPSS